MSTFNRGATDWADVAIKSGGDKDKRKIYLVIESETSHVMRIISKPHQYYFHWANDPAGKAHKLNCAAGTDRDCLVCKELGEGPKVGVMFLVLAEDKATGQRHPLVLDAGVQIFGAIRKLNSNPRWGPVKNYDIEISRGKKGDNPLYTVTALPSQPLTAEEIALAKRALDPSDEAMFIDLERLAQPATEVRMRMVVYGESLEDAKEAVGNGATAAPAPKATKVIASATAEDAATVTPRAPATKVAAAVKKPVVDDDDLDFLSE